MLLFQLLLLDLRTGYGVVIAAAVALVLLGTSNVTAAATANASIIAHRGKCRCPVSRLVSNCSRRRCRCRIHHADAVLLRGGLEEDDDDAS